MLIYQNELTFSIEDTGISANIVRDIHFDDSTTVS